MKTLSYNYENGIFVEEKEFNSINTKTNNNYSNKKRGIERVFFFKNSINNCFFINSPTF